MDLNEIQLVNKTNVKTLDTDVFFGGTGMNLRRLNRDNGRVQPIREAGGVTYGITSFGPTHRMYVAYDPKALTYARTQEPDTIRWMETDLYKWILGFLDMTVAHVGWKAMTVSLSWVQKEKRGSGIGKELYDTAVLHDGMILMAGEAQTPASMGVWRSMIKDPRYSVHAVDVRRPEKPLPVHMENDFIEILDGRSKLYSKKENKITLVASKAE